ncbi:MAG: T9SS type A sorting domain-containing protein [Bacteroidales bacterium]|nr:T9SS type A sorting domain-containing protein [Bacteroidales bacterium]MBN2820053.1 T9SS type A sorting domain-containing protein [Bacteroidales bacterium]
MKKTIIALILLIGSFKIYSQSNISDYFTSGLERVIVEQIPVNPEIAALDANLSANAVTYRIFIDMNPVNGLSVVIGDGILGPMGIKTTTQFYNTSAPFGQSLGESTQAGYFNFAPQLIYDSYICVGGTMSDSIGVPRKYAPTGNVGGLPLTTTTTPGLDLSMFHNTMSTANFEITDGAWSGVTKGGVRGPSSADSTIVMIGQFTTDGIFSFYLNIELTKFFYGSSEVSRYSFTGPTAGVGTLNPRYQFTPLMGVFGPGIEQPEIKILVPFDSVPSEINLKLSATASDPDGKIDSVEFRINTKKVGVDTSAPFEYIYTTQPGNHKISAVAIDNDGAVTMSEIIPLYVGAPNDIPTININSPDSAQEFNVGDIISFTVTVNDTIDSISKVDFYANNKLIGSNDFYPFSFNWEAERGDSVRIKAVVTDNYGASNADSSFIRVFGANAAPVVTFINPAQNEVIGTGIDYSVLIDAKDDIQVDSVEIYLDGTKLSTLKTGPFEYSWSTPVPGAYTLVAKGFDNEQKAGYDTIQVTVTDNLPPAVSITQPTEGDTYNFFVPLTVITNPVDSDGDIDSVQLYVNGILISTATSTPFEINWTPLKVGSNELFVKAFDNELAYGLSDTIKVNIVIDQAPSISLIMPVAHDTVVEGELVRILTNPTDPDGEITKVEFYINKMNVATVETEPFETYWKAQTGNKNIKATATDNDGLSFSQTIPIVVIPNTPPSVVISSPASGDEYIGNQSFNISFTASDIDGTIDSVEFYVDQLLEDVVYSSPYTISYITNKDSISVYGIAYDNRGKYKTSDTIKLFQSPNQEPIVQIINPLNNDTITPGTILRIEANATDLDGSIVSVEFLLNSTSLTKLNTSPYIFDWVSVEGGYTISAIASDNDGASTTTTARVIVGTNFSNSDFIDLEKAVKVFPNPFNNIITIQINPENANEFEQVQYIIYDLPGNLIKKGEITSSNEKNSVEVNLSSLLPGMYLLVIQSNNYSNLVIRLIKE